MSRPIERKAVRSVVCRKRGRENIIDAQSFFVISIRRLLPEKLCFQPLLIAKEEEKAKKDPKEAKMLDFHIWFVFVNIRSTPLPVAFLCRLFV
jgi:hypothetical protein